MGMGRRGGTKGKPWCWENAERLIYIFPHQQRKQCLEFALPKLREKFANVWLVLAIQTVMPVGYTILLLSAKQSRENQCSGASRFKENVSEKLSVIYPLWNEKSLANWICNIWIVIGIWRKKEICGHRLIMHSITHRGGECEKRVGGGGRLLYKVYTWTRWNVSDVTICETHKILWLYFKKGNFYLQRSGSGG